MFELFDNNVELALYSDFISFLDLIFKTAANAGNKYQHKAKYK
jgi:hypothetical protein